MAATTKAKRKSDSKRRGQSSKRELINTGKDKRFVRRNKTGQFKEVVEVGGSLAQDRLKKAKAEVKSGQGDKGDRKR